MREIRSKIEIEATYKGYDYVVLGHSTGHRCGYVRIPSGHPWYGKNYDEIQVYVHGGLTYSGFKNELLPSGYWVGFDCRHLNDSIDLSLIDPTDITNLRVAAIELGCDDLVQLKPEDTLKDRIMQASVALALRGELRGAVRSAAYVEANCKEVIDQAVLSTS